MSDHATLVAGGLTAQPQDKLLLVLPSLALPVGPILSSGACEFSQIGKVLPNCTAQSYGAHLGPGVQPGGGQAVPAMGRGQVFPLLLPRAKDHSQVCVVLRSQGKL